MYRNGGEKVNFWLLEMPVGLLTYLLPANPEGQREVEVPVRAARDTQASLGPCAGAGSQAQGLPTFPLH